MRPLTESLLDSDFVSQIKNQDRFYNVKKMPWLEYYVDGRKVKDYFRDMWVAAHWSKLEEFGKQLKQSAEAAGVELTGDGSFDPALAFASVIWHAENPKIKAKAKLPGPLPKDWQIVIDTFETLCEDRTIRSTFEKYKINAKYGWDGVIRISYMRPPVWSVECIHIWVAAPTAKGISESDFNKFIETVMKQSKKCRHIKSATAASLMGSDSKYIQLETK